MIQYFQFLAQHLDLPAGQVVVGSAFGTMPDPAGYLQYKLIAYPLGKGKGLCGIRVDNDLQQPFAVTQIDEDDPAVIAPAMRPANHFNCLIDQGFIHFPAVMSTHVCFRFLMGINEKRTVTLRPFQLGSLQSAHGLITATGNDT